MVRRGNGRLPLQNVQSESRAVERLIRIGAVKRLTGLSTATSEKGFEVAGCSRQATYTPTTVTNVGQYNEHLATGVLDVSWRCIGRRCKGGHPMENVQTESRAVERLIRIGEVKRLTGLSTATLYRKISVKEFPRPVRLGANACAWPLSEVQDWIARRIALRDTDEHGAAA